MRKGIVAMLGGGALWAVGTYYSVYLPLLLLGLLGFILLVLLFEELKKALCFLVTVALVAILISQFLSWHKKGLFHGFQVSTIVPCTVFFSRR